MPNRYIPTIEFPQDTASISALIGNAAGCLASFACESNGMELPCVLMEKAL